MVLGKLGTLEFYAYPDEFPDRVFYGIYPLSDSIEAHQSEDVLRIYNKIRWYFAEYWKKSGRTTKGAKLARQRIVRAYDSGANKRRKPK